MSLAIAVAWLLLSASLVLAIAPAIAGLARWMRARLMGRRGAPPWQGYRDLWRLVQKESIVATTASRLFALAPAVAAAATLLAASLVPFLGPATAAPGAADLILLVALLATARFATALGGLDVGSAFGALGVQRELFIAALAEPAMIMAVFALALHAGTTDLAAFTAETLTRPARLEVSLALALCALLLIAIAECGRIPVDNPATHLELTMVHEAMVLEYAGPDLALVEMAQSVRLVFFLSLIATVFLPWGMVSGAPSLPGVLIAALAWSVKLSALAIALAIAETLVAKMRVFRYAEFLGAALLLATLGVVFLFVERVA